MHYSYIEYKGPQACYLYESPVVEIIAAVTPPTYSLPMLAGQEAISIPPAHIE